MLVELGLCTGLLLVGDWMARAVSSLSLEQSERILGEALACRDKRREEEAKVADAAEKEKEARRFLAQEELRFRLTPTGSNGGRFTAEVFLMGLTAEAQEAIRAEIEAGTSTRLDTRAWLTLTAQHSKKGGRHDA